MNEITVYAPVIGMPVTAEHKHQLRALDGLMRSGTKINQYTNLLPIQVLEAIKGELATASVPTSSDNAAKWARILVNSFPAKDSFRDASHAKVFAHALAMDLAEFPQDIVEAVVHETRRANGAFIPGAGEVYRRAEAMMDERKTMARIVSKQLEEHERRKAEAAKPKVKTRAEMTEAERSEHDSAFEAIKAKYDFGGASTNAMPGTTKGRDGRTSEWDGISDNDIPRLREQALRGLVAGK